MVLELVRIDILGGTKNISTKISNKISEDDNILLILVNSYSQL